MINTKEYLLIIPNKNFEKIYCPKCGRGYLIECQNNILSCQWCKVGIQYLKLDSERHHGSGDKTK